MFGKKYDTNGLSDDDKAWAAGIGGFGGWSKALKSAVAENKPVRVSFLLRHHKMSRQQRLEMVDTAVQSDAGAALAAVLKQRGFDFDDSSSGDKTYARAFFNAALQRRDIDVWKALCECNETENSAKVGVDTVVRMAADAGWRDAIAFHLDRADARDVSAFNNVIAKLTGKGADDLAFGLSWSAKFNGHGPALNAALRSAAEEGAVDKAVLLLDKGANPDDDGGMAVYHALAFGHRAVFDLLVARGARLDVYGTDIVTRLRQQNPNAVLIDYAAAQVEAALSSSKNAEAQSRIGQRYHLAAPDCFSETLHLPEGRRLTTVFNFTTRQQTVIAEKPEAEGIPASMAISVRDFDAISDPAVIDHAAAQLVKLGGQVPEACARTRAKPASLPRPQGG